MKRWGIAGLVIVLACFPIWLARSSSRHLLGDTDTRAILEEIAARGNAWSWFASDWPLENHFYRPVSTLTFEFDLWAFGASAPGMGATNALLAIGCVLALFWLVRELADNWLAAAGCSILFSLWILDRAGSLSWLAYAGVVASIISMFLPQRDFRRGLMAALLFVFLAPELQGLNALRGRMIDWIPGRTASTMTLFFLLSIAAYVRYERLHVTRLPVPAASPFDRPATSSTELKGDPSKWSSSVSLAISIACFALALGSYEQAVMGPAIFLTVAWFIRAHRLKVRWTWPIASFGLVIGYLILRKLILPSTPSAYQEQQFRFTVSALYAIADFAMPAVNSIRFGWHAIMAGWLSIMLPQTWQMLLSVAANASIWLKVKEWPKLLVFGFVASILTLAPMAFLKPFDHYYFLPMALRTVFVIGLIQLALATLISAATRPAIQAPSRPDLA